MPGVLSELEGRGFRGRIMLVVVRTRRPLEIAEASCKARTEQAHRWNPERERGYRHPG